MESRNETEMMGIIHRDQEEQSEVEEEEELPLLLKTTRVVEYLEPLMSVELLCKFPDNSVYDFDYSQSTIWSPLVPRPYRNTPVDSDLGTPRKISYDSDMMGLEFLGGNRSSGIKVGSKIRNKFRITTAFIKKQSKNNKMKKVASSDLSPSIKGACNPIINKGWAKALKAASKQFKRWKRKREPISHAMLPKSFGGGDF